MRIITLIAAALLLFSLQCHAGTNEENPDKAREKLQQIEKELSGAKKKVHQAAKKERSILGQLERIDRSLAAKRTELKRLGTKLSGLSGEIRKTESEIRVTESRLEDRRAELESRLVSMYKTRRMGGPWLIMVSGEYGSLMKRYKYLSVMSERDRRLMDDFEEELESLKRQKAVLASRREEYDGVLTSRKEEAELAAREEKDKKSLLASVRKKKESYVALVGELEDASRRMKALIRKLEEAASRATSLPPGQFPPLEPGLDWPVTGEVTGLFGRHKHPRFDTYIDRKGIDIAAKMGSGVRAVEAAEVVYTDWFKGMGLVAILRHGGNYYSVYAHLADISVKTGDKVARGQKIATLGDTGTGQSPTLYFEIRRGSDPIDPLTFLKKR